MIPQVPILGFRCLPGHSYTMASSITSQTGGILSKRGDGKLILNANFDFGGGAAIYGGDLVIGTGGTSGRLNLSNSNFTFHNTGARYIYNRSAAVTKTHPFKVANSSASGSIDNIGGGTLTLTGAIDAGVTIPTTHKWSDPTNGTIWNIQLIQREKHLLLQTITDSRIVPG